MNTGIATYIWICSKDKPVHRAGRVQLIDASHCYEPRRKSIGTKRNDTYDTKAGLYVDTLIDFIKKTQPKEWTRFETVNKVDTVKTFCAAFNNACDLNGLVAVLRHGFKYRGIKFRVCYFKPESSLNQTAVAQYAKNHVACYRQWHYSTSSRLAAVRYYHECKRYIAEKGYDALQSWLKELLTDWDCPIGLNDLLSYLVRQIKSLAGVVCTF